MIRLITSVDIVKHTPMGGNVDVDKYIHLIDDAQEMVLKPVLGTKLYEKLLSDFESDNLADDYLEMYNTYVKKILYYSVFADYVKIGAIWVSNGGIYKHLPDNSETASQDEIDSLAKAYETKADTFISALERFLCSSSVDIPEYTTNQDDDYDTDPKKGLRTISGLFFS